VFSKPCPQKGFIKTEKYVFQTFQFRLKFTGTNPQFAEIFRYYITEAQIIQNRGYRCTLNETFYTVPLFLFSLLHCIWKGNHIHKVKYERGTCSKSSESAVFCRCLIWFLGKIRKNSQKIAKNRFKTFNSSANFSIFKIQILRINKISTVIYNSHSKSWNTWFRLENKIEKQVILVQTKTNSVVRKAPLQVLGPFSVTPFLAADKIGEDPNSKDMKFGPQTQIGAKSQSEEAYNWSQNREKWRLIFHGTEEEHGNEWLWQLGEVI